MLAQAQVAGTAPEAAKTLEAVFVEPWLNLLQNHPLVAALVLVPAGVAFLLWGFRLYRWLVVLAFVGVGIVAGVAAAEYFRFNQSIGIIAGSVVLGVLAWPLYKAAWGLLGGGVFAVVMTAVAGDWGIQGPVQLVLIAIVAFVAGGALTVLLMRPLIIIITSLVGVLFLHEGAFSLIRPWPDLAGAVLQTVQVHPYLHAAGVLILAAVGSVMQVVDTGGKKKKRRSSDGRD